MNVTDNPLKSIYRAGLFAFIIPVVAFALVYISGSMLLLDYVHVLLGAIWIGIDVFLGIIFTSVIKTINPETRKNIGMRMLPMTLFFIPSASIITPLAGYVLAVREGIFSITSHLFIIILILAAVLLIVSFTIMVPYSYGMTRNLSDEKSNLDKISRNMRIISIGALVQLVFQIAIVSLMAYIVVYL